MHFFTSVTSCYIPKARVLAKTLKKYNKNAVMHLVISDDLPENFDLAKEDFDYLWNAEDFIETENNKKWFYMHTVVELCTAVKGAAALHILKKTNTNKLIYLDPDIAVFNDLNPLSEMLDEKSVLITPHQTDPAFKYEDIVADEMCSLKYGIYNFGFFGVKNDENGLKFLNWWNNRLMRFCYDDTSNGLFVDQRWADLAPALFDFVKVVRELVYNVATWNLATRQITGDEKNGWKVNGQPLAFYHFSGFDSGAHREALKHHAKEGSPVWNLSFMYEKMLNNMGQSALGRKLYKYACYENGEKIAQYERVFFRTSDAYHRFENPFSDECCRWMKKNADDFSDIRSLYENLRKYKLLYTFSFGKTHQMYKARYKYFKRKMHNLEARIYSTRSCYEIDL